MNLSWRTMPCSLWQQPLVFRWGARQGCRQCQVFTSQSLLHRGVSGGERDPCSSPREAPDEQRMSRVYATLVHSLHCSWQLCT